VGLDTLTAFSISIGTLNQAHAVAALTSPYSLYTKYLLAGLALPFLELGEDALLTQYSSVIDPEDGGRATIVHKGNPWIGIPVFILGLVILKSEQESISFEFQKLNAEEAQLIGKITEAELTEYNNNIDLLNATTEMVVAAVNQEPKSEQKTIAAKAVFSTVAIPVNTIKVAGLVLSELVEK
jgi:hypothetical protein